MYIRNNPCGKRIGGETLCLVLYIFRHYYLVKFAKEKYPNIKDQNRKYCLSLVYTMLEKYYYEEVEQSVAPTHEVLREKTVLLDENMLWIRK